MEKKWKLFFCRVLNCQNRTLRNDCVEEAPGLSGSGHLISKTVKLIFLIIFTFNYTETDKYKIKG